MPKQHTTNYFDTLIQVAEDCPITEAEVPQMKKGEHTAASFEYEMISAAPYKHTSDDVLFALHAHKKGVAKKDLATARDAFFSKGQPCFRSSPLTKRYGFGVHSDAEGKIAIFPMESAEYKKLAKDKKVEQTRAMRSKRK